MKRKLAIIHTTPVTVESLKALALDMMPDIEVFNLVDDSILPQLNANGANIEEVLGRWRQYAQIAESLGADCILNACSSIGEVVGLVQPDIGVPIVRIDDAMAEYAVNHARVIGVAATLETTLQPTARLLKRKAEEAGKSIELRETVASNAYALLLSGDKEGHDEELAAVLRKLSEQCELVVLAQASMARVLSRFAPEEQTRFLTSPRLGMETVKRKLKGK